MAEKFRYPTRDEVKMFFDESWTHYIGSVKPPRPGFAMFSTTLEYKFFAPGTQENDDFKILSTGWHHRSLWMTVSIPTSKKHLAEAVAKYSGLKILKTFPVACVKFPAFATLATENWNQLKDVDPKWEAFPLYRGINVFSMENLDGHPVKSGKMSLSEWGDYETDLVGKIIGVDEWTNEDFEEMERLRKILDV